VVQRGVAAAGCFGAVWIGIFDDLLYGVWGVKRQLMVVCSQLRAFLLTTNNQH
jgi:hypothetical protein